MVKGTVNEGLLGDNGIKLHHRYGYHEVWEDVVQMKTERSERNQAPMEQLFPTLQRRSIAREGKHITGPCQSRWNRAKEKLWKADVLVG